MSNNFAVAKSMHGEVSVVAVEGFVDAHTAPDFEQHIQDEIEAGRCRIVVDCAQLSYISSAGLGVFMGFIEEARERGGDIKICGVVPKVRQVFDLLGFDAIFHMLEDVPAAVKSFAEGTVGPAGSGG
jgi:anti-sigma B factor antagonist